jgi:hypothetical protein
MKSDLFYSLGVVLYLQYIKQFMFIYICIISPYPIFNVFNIIEQWSSNIYLFFKYIALTSCQFKYISTKNEYLHVSLMFVLLLGQYSNGLWAGQLWNQGLIPGRARDFSLFHSVQTGSGTHPVSYPVGTGGFSPWGVKWVGHEEDHSSPTRD